MTLDFGTPNTHYGTCPACGGEMSGSADRSEGVTYEEEVFCHAGCYRYGCVTGNSEVRVGSREWHWSWYESPPFDEIRDHAALLAPAMRDTLGILGDAEANVADTRRYYRVAADRAEDAGDDGLAAGLRWLADCGRRPAMLMMKPTPRGSWGWYAFVPGGGGGDRAVYWQDHPHRLPPSLFSRIPKVETPFGDVELKYRWFKVRVGFPAAVLAAARAVTPGGLGRRAAV